MTTDDIYGSDKFKKLKAKWDKKLADAGFEDIENEDGSLKATTHPRTVQLALQEKEERETYYRIAAGFLHNHQFENSLERQIWTQHCDGIGARSIAKTLKITAYKAEKIINKLQRLAKLRHD